MQDLPGTVQEFRAFVDAAPAWRMASLRECVRSCLDDLAAGARANESLDAAQRERQIVERALADARLRDPARSPGAGWVWRTLGADIVQEDGSIARRPIECWTPPEFDGAAMLAARSQRQREAMAVALIVALHDEAVAGGGATDSRGIDTGALAGRRIIDDRALADPSIDGAGAAGVAARQRAWAGLRLYAMAERVEAQSWLAGAMRFLQAAGRDDLRRGAGAMRPESN
ncbi:MAG: hypothetical protein ACF8QF_01035 [Phycisphaerales bacterium]